MPVPLIFFHRLVVKSEVEALTHACALRNIKPVIICASYLLAQQLEEKLFTLADVILPCGKAIYSDTRKKTSPLKDNVSGSSIKTILTKRLKSLLLKSHFLKALFLVRILRIAERDFLHLYQIYNPTSIIVFDDRAPKEMLYISKANEKNIHTILVPFAASSVESCIFLRRDKPIYYVKKQWSSFLKRMVAAIYPKQVLKTAHGKMFLFSPWETFILGRWRLLTDQNWHHGGGQAMFNCLIGEVEQSELLEAGISPKRLILTGQPSLDALYKSYKNDAKQIKQGFKREFSLDAKKPIIICAVPHYAEHSIFEKEKHNKLTESLFSVLGGANAETLLSLHPKSDISDYKMLAETYHLQILNTPLSSALVAADIFIGGYSSTVRWAAMLGIATIIADLGKLYYKMYDTLPSLEVVFEVESLTASLNELISSSTLRKNKSVALADEAKKIGLIDGCACEKIISLM